MTTNPSTHRPVRRLVGLAAAGTIALAACGSDDVAGPADAETTVPGPDETAPPTTIPAPGGWIGGEPDWRGVADGDAAESLDLEYGADVADEVAPADAATGSAEERAEPAVEPLPPSPGDDVVAPPDDTPLRAGSVDDGLDFAGFLQYVERVTSAGFTARDTDLRGRIVVSVVDADGRPVPGAAVVAGPVAGADGTNPDAAPIPARTTADGTVRIFPALYGFDPEQSFAVGLADGSIEPTVVDAGGTVTLVAAPVALAAPVPLDVLFLLDATGSMGDEIDRLKTTIDTVAERVSGLEPRPDVRFAMTLYRDVGDAFVSSTFDFTDDVAVFRDALAEVVADGGGDTPEALDEGLAEALAAPAWRDPAQAVQLVFLVADAPPQVNRQVETPYPDSIRTAIERGIKIFPIASSESDDVAELVFRQLAVTTGAPFVFLSYGAAGAATGGSTDIDRTDYEELALDELVVRLIAEELADLTGGDVSPVPPTTVAPPTTNPEGQ